ncbi:MAG TPA: hypothetical protein VHW66_04850 [Stellaceae bacterium]|nr:hypothetical protein [Stellaceae bacterium]
MDCLSLDVVLPAATFPTATFPTASGREIHRSLPAVEPGQLWLVEICPDRGLSTAERHLLSSANVILYDRSLGAEVAAILPLGGYAEPAPQPAELPDPAFPDPAFPDSAFPDSAYIERCVRFAFEGWSVVRLIDASQSHPSREARLHAIAARLRASAAPESLPIEILADAGSRAYSEEKTRLGALDPAFIGNRNARLIVIFEVVEPTAARPPHAIAANGLAG